MKKIVLCFLFCLLSSGLFADQKQDLVNTLSKFNADDYGQIYQSMEKAFDADAKDTGFVKVSPVGGAGGFYFFFPGNGINSSKPAQAKSLTNLWGGAGGPVFNINKNFALGLLFGGMGGSTSTKIGSDFYEYATGGFFQMVLAKYKPIISEQFIVDFDLGLGMMTAAYESTKTDENFSGYEVSRWKDFQPCALIGADFRYRLSNLTFISLRTGYFYAKFSNLGRGDFSDAGTSLEFSAPYLAFTWGGNF